MKAGLIAARLVIAAGVVLPLQNAAAQTSQVKFSVRGTVTCVNAVSGFSAAPDLQLASAPFVRTATGGGTIALNLSGTGTWTYKYVELWVDGANLAVGKTPYLATNGSCDVAYAAQSDGTYNFSFSNCVSTFSGAASGTGVGTGTVTLTAVVTPTADSLTMTSPADGVPGVETVNATPTTGSPYSVSRICNRHYTGIRTQ